MSNKNSQELTAKDVEALIDASNYTLEMSFEAFTPETADDDVRYGMALLQSARKKLEAMKTRMESEAE